MCRVFQPRLVGVGADAQKLHLGRTIYEADFTDRPHLVSCADVRDVGDDQKLLPGEPEVIPPGSSVVEVVLPRQLQQLVLVEKELEFSVSVQLSKK